MPSVFGLPPDAFCLHLAAESSAAIASNVLLRTPVSRRNASPFSSLTESNLIAAPLWRQRIKPWLIEDYARGLMPRRHLCRGGRRSQEDGAGRIHCPYG